MILNGGFFFWDIDIEMLGTTLQFGGIKGEDRFYVPVRARKNYNQQKPSRNPTKTDETESLSSKVVGCTTKPCEELTPQSKSNLERFLEATRPSVPAQYFSKVNVLNQRKLIHTILNGC